MSVRRSARGIAYSEFERNMSLIHRELEQRMHALPARYKKHVCEPLYRPMNAAMDALIIADEQKGNAKAAKEKRQKYFRTGLQNLMAMEKPLMCFCNIREVGENGISQIGKMITYEIALIHGAAGWKEEPPVFLTLNREKAERLAFLKKMCELHRYTIQKTAHAPNNCFDALSLRIDDFATNALYAVFQANRKEPETREEAELRDQWLKHAIDCLNGMQRPMVGLWNIAQYSEKVMDEWAGMLDEEIRILTGLRKADRERFKNLRNSNDSRTAESNPPM